MAFPASGYRLETAYGQIRGRALDLKSQTQSLRNASAAGPVLADALVGYSAFLQRAKSEMQGLAGLPGLGAYAQAQENNGSLNITTEYNAMIAQIDATVSWLRANLPEDGSGYKLVLQIAADGSLSWRSFSSAQTAGLRTALDALLATIN